MDTPGGRTSVDAAWRRALADLLATAALREAPLHRALLAYLVAAANRVVPLPLKEAAIALDVFGRNPASYDPRRDAIVRVEIGRLRKRLAAAAAELPASAPHRIDIPVGSYAPVLSMRPQPAPASRALDAWQPPRPLRTLDLRVAVLPFDHPSSLGDADAFAVHQAVLTALAALSQLRLVSGLHNQLAALDAQGVPVLAARLGADLLLGGRLVPNASPGGQLVAGVRLLNGRDGLQLVQREIGAAWPGQPGWAEGLAQRIVDALAPWFVVPLRGAAQRPGGLPPEVAALLQRARLLARQATAGSEDRAMRLVEQAIRAHPGGAAAHLQLAVLHGNRANRDMQRFPQQIWQALGHAERAVQLDPADIDARAMVVWYRYLTELDLGAAMDTLRELSNASPATKRIHQVYGALCSHTGRTDEAVARFRLASEFDPMEVNPIYAAALAFVLGRRHEAALGMLDEVLELEPRHLYARRFRAVTLASLGREAEAARELADLEAEGGIEPGEAGALAAHFAFWRGDAGTCRAAYARPEVAAYVDTLPPLSAARALHTGDAAGAAAIALDMGARRDGRLAYTLGGRLGLDLRRDARIDAMALQLGWLPLA